MSTCPAKHRERVFAALRPLIERLEGHLCVAETTLDAYAKCQQEDAEFDQRRTEIAEELLDLRARLTTATEAAALWEAEAGRLREVIQPFVEALSAHEEDAEIEGDPLPGDDTEPHGEGLGDALTCEWRSLRTALSHPRPAPGAVVALVSDRRAIKAALGVVPTTAEEWAALDAGITRLQSALARALGMEEG